jgi:hypothetical protein
MADFSWGDGGVQMTPERIAAQRKVAEAMMAAGMDYSPIASPWQGASRVAQGMMGGVDSALADRAERANMTADKETIAKLLSGGASPAPVSTPVSTPADPATMSAEPRGIRNNNPGNIEDGPFAQKMPGYAGTDGRFAKFETPHHGMTAMDTLLASYGSRGINNVSGVVNRWAPPSDNNPTSAYAATVAKAMGVDPNAQIDLSDPAVRGKLAPAMAQFENGKPVPTMPAGAPVPAGPTQVAQAPANAAGGLQGVSPALIQALTSPYASEGTKKIAQIMLQKAMEDKVSYQTLPDGTIIALDPHNRSAPKAVYQAPTKPTWGVIGETADGGKQYGWIDAGAKAKGPGGGSGIEPYNATGSSTPTPITGPDGKPIAVPPGVDPKEFRKRVTESVADAATGKKTEVQAKDEKFANKMELAEKVLTDVGDVEGASVRGRMLDATIPFTNTKMIPGANYLQTDKYQQYRQAQDNFITALLRDESGAAIGTPEFVRYEKELFPQPGDGELVIKQKREARRIAIEGMKKGAGPGYKSPTGAAQPGGPPSGVDAKVWAAMTPEERALWK